VPVAVGEGEKLLLGADISFLKGGCFFERLKRIVDKTGECIEK
jgi:hypothetical protein